MKKINQYILEKFKINKETASKSSSSSLLENIMEVVKSIPIIKGYKDNSEEIEPLIKYWLNGYDKDISCYSNKFEFEHIGNLEYDNLSIYLESFDFMRDKYNKCNTRYYKSSKQKVNISEMNKTNKLLSISFKSQSSPIVFEKDLL